MNNEILFILAAVNTLTLATFCEVDGEQYIIIEPGEPGGDLPRVKLDCRLPADEILDDVTHPEIICEVALALDALEYGEDVSTVTVETTPAAARVGIVETTPADDESEQADESTLEGIDSVEVWSRWSNVKDFRTNAPETHLAAFADWLEDRILPLFENWAHMCRIRNEGVALTDSSAKPLDIENYSRTYKAPADLWQYMMPAPNASANEVEPCWFWSTKNDARTYPGVQALIQELRDEPQRRKDDAAARAAAASETKRAIASERDALQAERDALQAELEALRAELLASKG